MLSDLPLRWEKQGVAQTLLKLLNLKFNALPYWVEWQVNFANREQLDLWVERVLTVHSIEEIFS